MATSVRLSDDFVEEVNITATVENRSVPKQIEHWARIGKISEENPDLSYQFIRDALFATEEIKHRKLVKYERRTKRKD